MRRPNRHQYFKSWNAVFKIRDLYFAKQLTRFNWTPFRLTFLCLKKCWIYFAFIYFMSSWWHCVIYLSHLSMCLGSYSVHSHRGHNRESFDVSDLPLSISRRKRRVTGVICIVARLLANSDCINVVSDMNESLYSATMWAANVHNHPSITLQDVVGHCSVTP